MAAKAKKYISDTNLRRAKPGDVLWDKQITGLHIRIMPTGKRKFYMYYRTPDGREKRPSLQHITSLKDARELVAKLKLGMIKGEDPSDKIKENKRQLALKAEFEHGVPTVSKMCDLYMDKHRKEYKDPSNPESNIRLYIKPRFGDIRVDQLTLEQVEEAHEEMKDIPYAANRMLATLSPILKYSEKKKFRPLGSNFISHIKRYKEKKRKTYLEADTAPRVAEALHYYRKESPFAVAFILFAIMTGARKSEVANAKWEHIKGNALILEEHKTDKDGEDRKIVLAPEVMDFLNTIPRTVPMRGSHARNKRNRLDQGYIFAIASPDKMWQKIRVRAGVEDLRIHDLRHSFASGAVSADLTLPKIGGLLGHASEQTTKRYAHVIDKAAVQAATDTVGVLDEMMGGIIDKLKDEA